MQPEARPAVDRRQDAGDGLVRFQMSQKMAGWLRIRGFAFGAYGKASPDAHERVNV